jgi:hypothetical protein
MTRADRTLLPRAVFWPLWSGAMLGVVVAFVWAVAAFEGNARPVLTGAVLISLTALFMGLIVVLSRRCLVAAGQFKGAKVRYLWRLMPSMLAYVVLLFISSTVFKKLEPTGLIAVALAVMPALPLIVAVWAMAAYVTEEEDEVERAIQTQAFVWGTGAGLVILNVWGFLGEFELIEHADLWVAFPVIAVSIGLAQPLVRRRYR